MLNIKKQAANGCPRILKNKKVTPMKKKPDEITEAIRQSVIETKSKKFCVKDFSGDVFELTPDMMIEGSFFDLTEARELSGIAECILQKYTKLLSIQK